MNLGFEPDEINRLHKFNGILVPSVTQILNLLSDFSKINPNDLKIAQEFGTVVHKYLELFDAGTLDISKADDRIIPFIESWKAMKISRGWDIPVLSEIRYYSKKYGFTGRLDRLFKTETSYFLLDFKTGIGNHAKIQLAALLQLLRENYAPLNRVERLKIRFDVNGQIKSEVYPMSDFKKDFTDFLCVQRCWQLKKK